MRKRVPLLLTPLLLASCGGGSSGGGTPPAANAPPSFTSLQTASVIENSTAAYQATATDPNGNALTFSIDGGADAFLGFAPQPQELRAKKIGRVILNTAQDRPWSQYFCCMLSARRRFVQEYPIATKRALRAVLKATDMCAQDPARVARYLVKRGFEPRYEIGLRS